MIWDYQKLSSKRSKNQYCLKDILIKQKFGAPQGVAELNTDKSFASGNHKQPLVYLVAAKLPNYVATDGLQPRSGRKPSAGLRYVSLTSLRPSLK